MGPIKSLKIYNLDSNRQLLLINVEVECMEPLVSVLVPAYNHEGYIEECILSIAAQDYKNIELIIIDDGSTDGTWKKITQLEKTLEGRFARMLCLRQRNIGTAGTMRRLQGLCEGDYITSVASDDVLKPYMVSALLDEIVQNDAYGIVVGDAAFIDSNSKRVYWDKDKQPVSVSSQDAYSTFAAYYKKFRKDVDFSSKDFGSYPSLLRGNYISQAVMVRGDLYRKEGMFSASAPLEDWFFVLQAAKASTLRFVNKVVYSYRWHANNSIKNTQKMNAYSYDTLSFEYHTVMNGDDTMLKELVNEHIYKNKTVFRMPGLHLYKRKSFKDKKFVFEVCGRRIFCITYKQSRRLQ